jgi:hypothetical protein
LALFPPHGGEAQKFCENEIIETYLWKTSCANERRSWMHERLTHKWCQFGGIPKHIHQRSWNSKLHNRM